MIQLHGVSKFFDDRAAVDDIDLAVPEGSLFGLIGPNGAGKTTTLKMLATLIKPDRGRITIDGRDLAANVPAVRRVIGYMADAFGSFAGLTCEEYLLFFGRCYGLHGRDLAARVDDVLELTDLGHLRDDLTTTLSTGLRQRLALAKTFLHDPAILILDEPASGLDPRARIEIRVLLQELGKMGKTIVISSHILADLEEICTDIGIIEAGRVAWQGPLDESHLADGRKLVTLIEVPPGSVDRALALVRELGFVSNALFDGQRIEAETPAEETNRLLRTLIENDIEIHRFERKKLDLETLFLESTKGTPS